MTIAEHLTHFGEKFIGSQVPKSLIGETVAFDKVGSIIDISGQGGVAAALGLLAVGSHAEKVGFDIFKHFLVRLGIEDEILHNFKSLPHVLAESAQGNYALMGSGREVEITGKGIHAGGDVLGTAGRSTKIFKVVECRSNERAVLRTEIEHELQIEYIILSVTFVKHVHAIGEGGGGHVLGEVHEHRGDRLHLGGLDLLEEGALAVAVRHDRGDLRSCDFLDIFVFALTLVDHGIRTVGEIFIRKCHHIFLCHSLITLKITSRVFPVDTIDKRIHIHLGT